MLINQAPRSQPHLIPQARPAVNQSRESASAIPSDKLDINLSSVDSMRRSSSVSDLKSQAFALAEQAQAGAVPGAPGITLRVLSLNTYFDSNGGLEAIENLIRDTKADLVGLQEVNQSTSVLAENLGMHYLQQDKRTALLSRFPIKEVSPKKFGVKVELENGQEVGFFNVHATSFPFQPAQIARKPSGGGPYINNEADAIRWADWTRGAEFRDIISEANAFGAPAVVTGDFNEPSHLDWTPRATEAGLFPFKVQWPGSSAFEKAGFKDSYREMNPDEVARPGQTWPANEQVKPGDPNVRIDYVMHRGDDLKLVSSHVIGENSEASDIVLDPYPTDHRAILATFEVKS